MSDMIRLSTADGLEVFNVPAGAACQWSHGCTRPAVQMRRFPGRPALPVCEFEAEHREWFRHPAARHTFEVPGVGPVVVVFGKDEPHPSESFIRPNLVHRSYQVWIGGVIAAEGDDFSTNASAGDPASAVGLCRVVCQKVIHASDPWRTPLLAWTGSERWVDAYRP